MKTYDLIGIGNALSDITLEVDDNVLQGYDLVKGTMLLTESEVIVKLRAELDAAPHHVQPGGSCGNSIALFAKLGGDCGFIGKAADDESGRIYRASFERYGIEFLCPLAETDTPSGSCLVLVSKDAQRTMVTALGIAGKLTPQDIDDDTIARSRAVYLEGYLYDQPQAKQAFEKAASIARGQGAEISLSLSDVFCVERHLDDFRRLVNESCDILFANEQEFYTLYHLSGREEAIGKAKTLDKTICLTLSGDGSYVIKGDETYQIPPYRLGELCDTTGAGDSFAGGFLYGLHHRLSLEQSGHLASLLAGDVVTHYGPRSDSDIRALITKHLDFSVP